MENKEVNQLITFLKNNNNNNKKTPKIIQETLSDSEKNTDNGTMLDESQLIDEN